MRGEDLTYGDQAEVGGAVRGRWDGAGIGEVHFDAFLLACWLAGWLVGSSGMDDRSQAGEEDKLDIAG